MRALIIAGGEGTRLRPLTYKIPKPVIPVVNKPLLEHQIELLKKHGITEIILAISYLPEKIKKILGDGHQLGVKLFYAHEKTPLGTGGAVKNAAKFFDGQPLIILNGDIITDLDLETVIDFYNKNRAALVLVLTPVADPSHYGLVVTARDGRVEKFLEKPSPAEITTNTINAGTYIMDTRLFDYWTEGAEFSFERDLFPRVVAAKERCYGWVHQNYWMDLGSPAKYLQAHFDILLGKINLRPAGRLMAPGVWAGPGSRAEHNEYRVTGPAVIGRNCRIDPAAVIGELTTLGDEVVLAGGARVEKCIIMTGARIGCQALVRDSIIGENAVLEDDVLIENGVLAHDSVIKKGSRISGHWK